MNIAHAIMFTYWLLDEWHVSVHCPFKHDAVAQQHVPRAQSWKSFMENINMFK